MREERKRVASHGNSEYKGVVRWGINVRVTPPLTEGGERVLCAWHLNIVADVGGFGEGLLSIAIADRTVPFVFTPLLLALQAILMRPAIRDRER